MSLPARIPKKRNRSERWRSQAHCTFVRGHQCCVAGCDGRPIEVAHLRVRTDAALGRKASDFYTISLCRVHHGIQHAIGELKFQSVQKLDFHMLAEEFCAASPKSREIAAAKQERGL